MIWNSKTVCKILLQVFKKTLYCT